MTLQEYNDRLKLLSERTSEQMEGRIIMPAASRLIAGMHNRVFRDGEDSNGSKIGDYSTKPGYYSKKQFIQKGKFKAIGQRGFKGERVKTRRNKKTKEKEYFIQKKAPKSMFLKGGYKELRAIQGRWTSFVNLDYTGSLRSSLILGNSSRGVLIGFNNEKESNIRRGLEMKYRGKINSIFPASAKERETYSESVVENLREEEIKILK